MNYDLKIKNKNELVHIPCSINLHPELEEHYEYRAKLHAIRDTVLHNCTKSSIFSSTITPYMSTDPEALQVLYDSGYKYACVWFDGSFPDSGEFDDVLIDWLNSIDYSWMAAGHIIDRLDGHYPYWHEQIIVLNLSAWNEVNQDSIKHNSKPFAPFYSHFEGATISPERSEEHIHDDYTPLWLKYPSYKTSSDHRPIKQGFGNPIIPKSISRGYSILNIPFEVRKHKTCVYVEDDIQETISWLMNYELEGKTDIREIKHLISEDKRDLASLKFMTESIVYFTNTEGVPNFNRKNDFSIANMNTFIVPCSGLFQMAWMIPHIDSIEHVIFYDVNPNSVLWMEHLITNWNGTSQIDTLIAEYKEKYADKLGNANYIYEPHLVQAFIDAFDEEERVSILKKLNSLGGKLEFIKCNIVNNSQMIVDKIEENSNVFINMTNILQYESNYLNNDVLDVKCNFYAFIGSLRKKSNKLFFNGDTPRAQHISCTNVDTVEGL